MTNCAGCGKKIGIFESTKQCTSEYCSKKFCDICAKSNLSNCDNCAYKYCKDHIINHGCEGEFNFRESIKGMTEKQLLKLLVLLKWEENNESISENYEGLFKIAKEE